MILDILVAVIIGFGFYIGYSRGIIKTLFDVLSLVIGILAAINLTFIIVDLLNKLVTINEKLAFIIGFVITFLLVMALIRFIGRKLESMFKAANINFINKICGGILQSAVFVVLLGLAIGFLSDLKIMNEQAKAESATYPFLEPIPGQVKPVFTKLVPYFKELGSKASETMQKIGDKVKGEENSDAEN